MMEAVEQRSDTELILAIKAGDRDALAALVGRHQRAAIRVAAVALGSPDAADDVAQEAFVKLYHSIERFRIGERVEPWLFRIVTNTARNRLRSETRQRALQVRAAAQVAINPPGPDEVVVHGDDRQQMIAAIGRLRFEDRLILTYRWFEEMTEAEMAAALQCRPGTVKSRLNRAMVRLRAELGES